MNQKNTIRDLLEYRGTETPDAVFGIYADEKITCARMWQRVNQIANGLAAMGAGPGDRIALMLANHPDHIFTVFAIASIGAVWVPINIHLKGAGLNYILEESAPLGLIIDAKFWEQQQAGIDDLGIKKIVVRQDGDAQTPKGRIDFQQLIRSSTRLPETRPTQTELRCISFTSGTTGPPKGVFLTEQMLFACARGAAAASDVQPGDVYLLWEPIYHNSGIQMCILALMEPVRLIIISRFSASRFWDQVRKHAVTKLHYLGGIVDILLKQPPGDHDRDHHIQIAFGAGCRQENWCEFEGRFGVRIHEAYGLTEASGFTTLNRTGKVGSVGKPLPDFEVKVVDPGGAALPAGQMGEILTREKISGLITKGYHKNPGATAGAIRDGWLHTGDLGFLDPDGDLFYVGRTKDCIRRRGENISAWEVERVLNMHPEIIESAVIGVESEVGEQDVKVFLNTKPGASLKPLEIIQWCETRMPYYQIPRYIDFVESFEKTPTQRIRKKELSTDLNGCWDLEKTGYKVDRS